MLFIVLGQKLLEISNMLKADLNKVDKQGRAVSELQRAPSPEEVAQLVLFLAGPGAGTVTGQVMPIEADGRMVR